MPLVREFVAVKRKKQKKRKLVSRSENVGPRVLTMNSFLPQRKAGEGEHEEREREREEEGEGRGAGGEKRKGEREKDGKRNCAAWS